MARSAAIKTARTVPSWSSSFTCPLTHLFPVAVRLQQQLATYCLHPQLFESDSHHVTSDSYSTSINIVFNSYSAAAVRVCCIASIALEHAGENSRSE
jgi:hypothetical protein